ncbi:MAG TPA: septal ring lytic transglycosylase RlpA family protein [Polyangiaceae bacterium]|nr:septal ring lytic transglycosylase RlpA family protein [Polyangiaceae bacterium]
MARPLAVKIGLRRSLLLALGALACGPALTPPRAERATATSPVAAPPADVAVVPPSSEQVELRQRFDSVKALSSQRGEASYYADSLAGRSTASGEPYEPARFTAAHRKLPFGTMLRVKRTDDGRSVYVRVNDRGPYGGRGRIVDLSKSAAEELGMLRQGVVKVTIEVVERADARAAR